MGNSITEVEVLECQAKWANAIKTISKTYKEKGDYIGAAGNAAAELYGYGHSKVLFKPTKAAQYPFRPKGNDACRTLSVERSSMVVMQRTADLQSTGARAGPKSCSKTTTLIATETLRSLWGNTSSRAQPRERKSRWNIPSATSEMMTAKLASSSTILLSLTRDSSFVNVNSRKITPPFAFCDHNKLKVNFIVTQK